MIIVMNTGRLMEMSERTTVASTPNDAAQPAARSDSKLRIFVLRLCGGQLHQHLATWL
jgi:hypothetical protein